MPGGVRAREVKWGAGSAGRRQHGETTRRAAPASMQPVWPYIENAIFNMHSTLMNVPGSDGVRPTATANTAHSVLSHNLGFAHRRHRHYTSTDWKTEAARGIFRIARKASATAFAKIGMPTDE